MSTAPPKESSTFSQEEIDALFGGGGFNPPPAPPPAAPSPEAKGSGAAPAATKPSEPQPVAAQPTAPQPTETRNLAEPGGQTERPPRPGGPAATGFKPAETKPIGAQPAEAKPVDSKPQAPVVTAATAEPAVSSTKAHSHLVLPHNRSGLGLLLVSFLAGIVVTLVGVYCWTHPFFVPQSVLTAVTRARRARPAPPPPQQRVLVGTPVQVAAQFNSVTGFSISSLTCTGYQLQGAEILPIITLVVSETHTTDRLICASDASVAEMSVNRLFQDGYKVHCSLVSLPAFRQGSPTPNHTWHLFALRKEPGPVPEAKMTLFETEGKTARILQSLLQQGWSISQVAGRPLELQTNFLTSTTTMTAVILERARD